MESVDEEYDGLGYFGLSGMIVATPWTWRGKLEYTTVAFSFFFSLKAQICILYTFVTFILGMFC